MKQLAFFFDGSGVSAAGRTPNESNVFRLNRALTFKPITFYFSGVGTRRDVFSEATGGGLDEIIREAYVNLSSNYQPNDEIYVFGFSRGAIAARAFTGLITKSGLASADAIDYFADVWKYFLLDPSGRADEREWARLRSILDNVVYKDSEKPRIKFLGLFDSVIGTYWKRLSEKFFETRFHSTKLDPSVEVGLQLLSIDDNRIPSFKPLLWSGPCDKNLRIGETDQHLEQVWIPGVHGDVGGCSGACFLNNVALLTMIGCARHHCPQLEWDSYYVESIANGMLKHPFEVSAERRDIWNWILSRGDRTIGSEPNEKMHPIFPILVDQPVILRGKPTDAYDPKNAKKALEVNPLETYRVPLYDEVILQAASSAAQRAAVADTKTKV